MFTFTIPQNFKPFSRALVIFMLLSGHLNIEVMCSGVRQTLVEVTVSVSGCITQRWYQNLFNSVVNSFTYSCIQSFTRSNLHKNSTNFYCASAMYQAQSKYWRYRTDTSHLYLLVSRWAKHYKINYLEFFFPYGCNMYYEADYNRQIWLIKVKLLRRLNKIV